MTAHDYQAILNMLCSYAQRIDSGDLDVAATLFAHARLKGVDARREVSFSDPLAVS